MTRKITQTTRTWPRRFPATIGWLITLCILSTTGALADPIDTIATMEDLRVAAGDDGDVVRLLGYHAVSDGGGGLFMWDADCVDEDDGGTVIARAGDAAGRWMRMADDTNVRYFGARGDGVTDDTAAIQAAIDSVSSTAAPGVIFEEDRTVGGTVHFPRGKYRITDTLLVGPNTTLTGTGSALGFQRRGVVERDAGSVIIARFDDPVRWMISSAVYFREGEHEGQLVPAREIVSGRTYDRGTHSRVNAVQIRDLLLIGEENADGDPPYGGIRLQACPGSVLQGVGVFGVDIAYMLNAGWGLAMRDCTSGSYLYGLLALYNVNGLLIDNCYLNMHSSDRLIDEDNVAPGNLSDRGTGGSMPEDYPFRKTGILSHYGHNITLNNVITEHWEIARFHIHGQISDTGSWLEGNDELGYALVTVDLDLRNPHIYQPAMTGEGRFLRAGTNVRATVSNSPAFPITWGSATANRISVLVPDPDRAGWKHYPAVVSYANRESGHVRVGADDSEDVDNTRLADTTTRVDLTTALERIEASDRRDWTVSIADGATCDVTGRFAMGDRNVTFVGEEGDARPVIRFAPGLAGETPLEFAGGGCAFRGVDIAVSDGAEAGESAIVGVRGDFDLGLADCSVALADSSLLTTVESPAVIDAVLSGVEIRSGRSIFVASADGGSVISCMAADTTAPATLLARGVNGWQGEHTEVLHSNIAPAGD